MPEIFLSRDARYKTPRGAARRGEPLSFRIRPSRGLALSGAQLCLKSDADPDYGPIPMEWEALEAGADVYAVTLQGGLSRGLHWYYFRLIRPDGGFLTLGRGAGGAGVLSEQPNPWQLCVYEDEALENDWFGKGITYHIFPDRFCRTRVPPETGWRSARRIHENWDDTPDFLPDRDGEIKNDDFFGGSLEGILSKLPYLASLHVCTLYLGPVFEAASNHRYDTGDYMTIDPMLGAREDFERLCREARAYGIRIILDGVFSHTGFDSRYFNGRGSYDSPGAYQSKDSPYFPWYDFHDWPLDYSCWWGIRTLPQTREEEPGFQRFIFGNEDSVVKTWLCAGASGFRLDVADELPDAFIFALKEQLAKTRPDAVLVGEVWEDASSKISYGQRRQYILGHGLDSVMNYPFRSVLISYLRDGDAAAFRESMESLRENYPPKVFMSLMNHIGTHDTPRILTVLGADPIEAASMSVSEKAAFRLPPKRRARAVRLLKIGAAIQFCFPGSPAVYYGDEAGMEGFEDPLNRGGYPWGREDEELLAWYRLLGGLRDQSPALQSGFFEFLPSDGDVLVFSRSLDKRQLVVAANRGDHEQKTSLCAGTYRDLVCGEVFSSGRDGVSIPLLPLSVRILRREDGA